MAWHARTLRLPVLGRYMLGVDVARFSATLAILTGSNVPLLGALNAARRTLKNCKLQAAVAEDTSRVRERSALAPAWQAKRVLPPLLCYQLDRARKSDGLG